jgi:pimeloyl-ACP methyl ester carboxylesterase
MEAYAQFLHEFIQREAQPHGKAVIGGFSMGGYILMALLRAHPEDVAAAMLIDTRAEVDTPEARAARLASIQEIQKNGPAAFLEGMVGRLLGKKAPAAVRQHVLALMSGQSPQAIIAAQSAMARRRDQSDLLATLSMPTLILVGAEDAITPPSVAVSMQSHMPHAMLVQIVSSGHMTLIEQPDAVNAALRAFLATVRES